MTGLRWFSIALILLMCRCLAAHAQEPFTAGTWTKLNSPAPSNVRHIQLLTDGTVLANAWDCNATGTWYRLTPDSSGSYLNGTWTTIGSMPAGYNPLYFASAVLPNGQFIVMGGTYNACSAVFTTLGAIYNPTTDAWSAMTHPAGWTTIGDAQSVVLPNGKFMLANCCTSDQAILTISGTSMMWAPTGAGKADLNHEEGWTLLPNGNPHRGRQ